MRNVYLVILIVTIVSCNFKRSSSLPTEMKIAVDIYPENGDTLYWILWDDTIGHNHYKQYERPQEIWCDIINDNDTLGYYHGMSTAHTYTYFHVSKKDSVVELHLKIANNIFSEHLKTFPVPVIVCEFEPVVVNLRKEPRLKQDYILKSRRSR